MTAPPDRDRDLDRARARLRLRDLDPERLRLWLKQFIQDWGIAVFLVMGGIFELTLYIEDQRVIAAKERIARDRASIAETRMRVIAIEQRLLTGNVPDRLDRIEKTIGSAVEQNQAAIRALDERQQKVAAALEAGLGISKGKLEEPEVRVGPEPR